MIIDWTGQHLYVGNWNAWSYNPYGVEEGVYVPAVLLYDGHIHGLQTPNVNQPGYPQYSWFGVSPENLGIGSKPDIHDRNLVADGEDRQETPAILGAYNVIAGGNKQGSAPSVVNKYVKTNYIDKIKRPEIIKK